MAHYAQLNSENIVVAVFVGRDEDDLADGVTNWETYYAPNGYTVKQTSYNTRGGVHYDPETGEPSEDQTKALRFNYAGIGLLTIPSATRFYQLRGSSRGCWTRLLVSGWHLSSTLRTVVPIRGTSPRVTGSR